MTIFIILTTRINQLYTNDKILYLLKRLKKPNDEGRTSLTQMVESELFQYDAGRFINHVENLGYIHHDQARYYITKSGESFVVKQRILKTTKSAITYFFVPTFVILTFIFQFLWRPDFLKNRQAMNYQTGKMDSKSETLSKSDSLSQLMKTDTTDTDSLRPLPQDSLLSPKHKEGDK